MITNFADMIVEYDDVIPADKCQEIIEKFEYDHRKSAGITASDTEGQSDGCLLYTSPSPRDLSTYRRPASA